MKIDEVQGPPEVPQIRSQDVARQGEIQRQSVPKVRPADQVDLSQAARQTGGRDATQRAASLRHELRNGSIDPQEVAASLLKDGVLP